jgi:hypothetical protein
MSSAKSILRDVWLNIATTTQEESEPESYQAGAPEEKERPELREKETPWKFQGVACIYWSV